MSSGLNEVVLIGNLGGEPELRETHGAKKSVCNFRLATNESRGKGEFRKERTEWHPIVVWGMLAELCAEHLKTGSKIYLRGHMQTRRWTDRDNQPRMTTEVVAEKIIFLDSKITELLAVNIEWENLTPIMEEMFTAAVEAGDSTSVAAEKAVKLAEKYVNESAEALLKMAEQSE